MHAWNGDGHGRGHARNAAGELAWPILLRLTSETPLLALEGVSKRYGGLLAVSDLHLVVHRGELRCLIGPNGAGKSTVFKLIMGFERVSSGRIML